MTLTNLLFILAFGGLIGVIALRELPLRMRPPLLVLIGAATLGMLAGDAAWSTLAPQGPGLVEWTRHVTQFIGAGAAIGLVAAVRLTRPAARRVGVAPEQAAR